MLFQCNWKLKIQMSFHYFFCCLIFVVLFVCLSLIVFILERLEVQVSNSAHEYKSLRSAQEMKKMPTSKFIFNDLFPQASLKMFVCVRKVNRKTISMNDKSSDSHQQSIAKYIIVICRSLVRGLFCYVNLRERTKSISIIVFLRRWYLNCRVAVCLPHLADWFLSEN